MRKLFIIMVILAFVLGCHHQPPPMPPPVPPPAPAPPPEPPTPEPPPPEPEPHPAPQLPPTDRAYRLRACFTFSGLLVPGTEYGDLPMFEPAGSLLNAAGRKLWYDAKHASSVCGPGGDTHAMLWWATSARPSYDSPGQPYQHINTVNWAADMGGFRQLVEETLGAGFVPIIFMDGDMVGPSGVMRDWPQLHASLLGSVYGDLSDRAVFFYCFDSCFYGNTEPEDFRAVAARVKGDCPTCLLITEFNIGHIPVGGGPSDYQAGGRMAQWDGVAVEFDDNVHQDSTWQVLGRLLGPAYRRPADQPAGDDPHPPMYLRPDQVTWCMESFNTYHWVRVNVNDAARVAAERATYQAQRDYLNSLGCAPAFN